MNFIINQHILTSRQPNKLIISKIVAIIVMLFLSIISIKAQIPTDSTTISSLQQPNIGIEVTRTLPVFYVETENHEPITSKTEYLYATYWIDPCENDEFEALGSEENPMEMQIRGRGHSSWKAPKKPYKIKLSEKLPLLGMAKNKHWALLKPSEATVPGLHLGELLELPWTPHYRPVEVVLNGVNIGLYFLTETIRIDKNRVNIYEQEDFETDPNLICGGWLVEIDNYLDDNQITIKENNKWNLTLKYHSPENLSDEQLQWLRKEFVKINQAVYSADKLSTEWEEYIDVESMAKFFIIQEIMDNPDGFHGSFYLHKDYGENSKWVAGPIWDMNCYNREKTDYTFKLDVHYKITPHWIGEIIQYDSFCKEVRKIWENIYPAKLSEIYDYIDAEMLPIEEAWDQNQKIWEDDSYLTARQRAEYMKTALERNIEWFNGHLPETSQTSHTYLPAERNTGCNVYNLQGIFIGKFDNELLMRSTLKKGIYIINGKKIFI